MGQGGRFGVLGSIRAVRDDGTTIEFNSRPAQRALLAYLIAQRGTTRHADEIVATLWPSDDASTDKLLSRLRHNICRLRDEIGDADRSVITTQGPGYRLIAESVDADEFARLGFAARRLAPTDPRRALLLVERAHHLWDEPYLDVAYLDFARSEVERLRGIHRCTLITQSACLLALGETSRAVDATRVWDSIDLRDERLVAAAIMALYEDGRTTAALALFRDAADDLAISGLAPSARLARIEEQVLMGHEVDPMSLLRMGDDRHRTPLPRAI